MSMSCLLPGPWDKDSVGQAQGSGLPALFGLSGWRYPAGTLVPCPLFLLAVVGVHACVEDV